MSNAFLGQITMFAGNYAPKGTAFCNGQILSIQQNAALFSLLGTTYGGNGVSTFALPNLQSNITIHQGQGQGLSSYTLGQAAGNASVTLDQNTTPTHIHVFNATQTNATSPSIGSTLLAGKPTVAGGELYAVQQSGLPLTYQNMNPAACANAGGSQPHTNLMPSLCITFVIFLQGIFPSRN